MNMKDGPMFKIVFPYLFFVDMGGRGGCCLKVTGQGEY